MTDLLPSHRLDVLKRQKTKKKPQEYDVVLLNDDYTPFGFAIGILIAHFHKSGEQAVTMARQIHERGSVIAGTYPREVAETKAIFVVEEARDKGHPFLAVCDGPKNG
jgi:ATP-dependent Clp protease adaptor protein ClpS